MSKSNISDAFKIQYWMLNVVGAWPRENPTLWYKIRGVLCFCSNIVLTACMATEAYNNRMDFVKVSESLCMMITAVSSILKYVSFFVQRKTFINMISELRGAIFLSYSEDLDIIMANKIKYLQRFSNVFRYMVHFVVIMVILTPILDEQSLPFPIPYDLGRYKWAMYLLQSVSAWISGWTNPSIDSLFACLLGVATAQLEILQNKIVRLHRSANKHTLELNFQTDKDIETKLKQCVDHHVAIIKYLQNFETVFSFGAMVQILACVIVICNTLFRIVLISVNSSEFVKLAVYFSAVVTQLLLYCWFGEEIIHKSLNVQNACYFSSWFDWRTGNGKLLFVIMERSKRPLNITAFKFVTLSLFTFTATMRWAYSYFALLLNMYKARNITI